ncbi:MAG: DnaJ domain-containing protein [Pseudomonadota bacterium]
MASRDPFGFDISVSSDKKKRARRRGMSGAVDTSQRICEHPNCEKRGTFRAPKSPDRTDDFYWFCKDHIREYNARWNYFKEHSPEELEEQMKRDQTWDRPTFDFKTGTPRGEHSHAEGRAWERFGFNDPFQALGDNATINRGTAATGRSTRRLPPEDRRALKIMGAEETVTKADLRKLYKSHVKDLHPDMNGGRRDDEERLAEIVTAWEHLKTSRAIPES